MTGADRQGHEETLDTVEREQGKSPGTPRVVPRLLRRRGIQRKLLLSHLRVAAMGIIVLLIALASTELLRSNALRLARDRGPAVNASLQALSGVQRSVAELSGWLAFRNPVFKKRRASAWRYEIVPAIKRLDRVNDVWGANSVRRRSEFAAMLADLRKAQARVEALAERGDANVQSMMEHEVIPKGRRVIGFLHGVSSGQMALMEVDAASVSLISGIGVAVSALLVVLMAGFAWSMSRRGADRITEPIRRLSRATEALAQGRITEDVPVIEEDEIGQLTEAFNVMRSSLIRATESIRETAERLGKATAQILTVTTQQAKGTREQAKAVHDTAETVEEAARVSEAVTTRSHTVSGSVESAAGATKRGRRALEDWIADMGALRQKLHDPTGRNAGGANGTSKVIESLDARMRQIHDTMETLAGMLEEVERLAGETDRVIQGQSERLADVRRSMGRVDHLAGESFERTIQVEQVAQELKVHSRELHEMLTAYAVYAPGRERSH